MKKYILFAIFAFLAKPCFSASFIEGQAGLANEIFGVSGGISGTAWEGSLDFQKKEDGGVTLNMIGATLYRNLLSIGGFKMSVGFGGGMLIPNAPDSKANESDTIDNTHYYNIVGKAEYKFGDHWAVGGGVKSLLANSDTHRRTVELNQETLSNGQGVVTATPVYQDNSRDWNSIFLEFALRYYF